MLVHKGGQINNVQLITGLRIAEMSQLQYNLSNPACYQTEKKIRIRQGTGIERLTYPRDIKVTLVSIQHTVDNGYVNELYTQIYSRLKKLF